MLQNHKCSSFYSYPVSFLGGASVTSFLCIIPEYSTYVKMDDGTQFCILLYSNFIYFGDLIRLILNKKRYKCQNMVSLFVTKSFLNSKDNIQNILPILQTALRFIFPSVITSIFFFFVCALDMFCRFQELHNFLLSSFCVSTLNSCPWQFAWEGAHFSGFSLRSLLDPSFRAHCSP